MSQHQAAPMSDGDRTIGEAFRLIDDTRANCANRAARHVDKDVWNERNRQIDAALASQGQRIGDLEAKLVAERTARETEFVNLRKRQDNYRLALITAIVGAVTTAVLSVLAVASGVGVGA
jgi:hypothetical protein